MIKLNFFFSSLFIAIFAPPAISAEGLGVARPWQLGFQEAASPIMEKFEHLHDFLLVIITLITIFVLGLLTYICIRFRRSVNPKPSTTAHNTTLEIIWTIIPVVILIAIAIPSVKILYYAEKVRDPEMTLKVVGHQWYWSYEYPDHGNIKFESNIIKDEEIKPGQHRLLEVDNRVFLPVDTTIRIATTAADVLHAWAVPAFGVKKDAVPGRLNETWVRITKPGVYYGQCSELCGVGHGFMPIVVEAVSKEEFNKWVESKKKKTASLSKNKNIN